MANTRRWSLILCLATVGCEQQPSTQDPLLDMAAHFATAYDWYPEDLEWKRQGMTDDEIRRGMVGLLRSGEGLETKSGALNALAAYELIADISQEVVTICAEEKDETIRGALQKLVQTPGLLGE